MVRPESILETPDDGCEHCLHHKVMTLTTRTPEIGEPLVHFGCHRTALKEVWDEDGVLTGFDTTLSLRGYAGEYESINTGDRWAPGVHFATRSFFPSGSSGGPTTDRSGRVCGVNSSSMDSDPPYGRLTRVVDLLNGRFSGDVNVNGKILVRPTFADVYEFGGGDLSAAG